MKISPHFTLKELTDSYEAVRRGINNTPPPEVLPRLRVLAAGLERVRTVLAVRMYPSSGYRCPRLNAELGGAATSLHVLGLACDFTAPDFGSPLKVCRALEPHFALIGWEELIHEGRWVHIAWPPEGYEPKGECFTARFLANGKRKYVQGFA